MNLQTSQTGIYQKILNFKSLPLLILFVGWGLSAYLFYSIKKHEHEFNAAHFDTLALSITHSIQMHMNDFKDVLQGGVSLYAASESVQRSEWRAYTKASHITEQHPGVNGMGVILPVYPNEKASFLDQIRADEAPDFEIHPVQEIPVSQRPPADVHYVITYIEPEAPNRAALGLDIASEWNRRKAAEESRDTGELIMSSRITLVQDEAKRPAFLIFLPIYNKEVELTTLEQRRQALIGWTYAPFVTENFLSRILSDTTHEISLFLFEGSTIDFENLLYTNLTAPEKFPEFEKVSQLKLAGKTFTIGWSRSPNFIGTNTSASMWVVFFSALVSLLFSTLISIFQRLEQRARILVEERTQDLKESEKNLKESEFILEQKIKEANYAHENLIQTQEQLLKVQKMESIGNLAGGIAHDFNNILSGILGYASILKEKWAHDPKTLRQLEVIERSAKRGAELTKQLLGFARKEKSEKKIFKMNEVIQEAIRLLTPTLGEKVSLHHKLQNELWPIEGDSGQILQVLVNLGINARDAMPQGGEIHISSENYELYPDESLRHDPNAIHSGSYVHVIFRDTGTGIPKHIQEKIFDPFFSTKAPGKGTGLGLSMVYGIIQNHDGILGLESDEGKGTIFHLYFPATKASSLNLDLSKSGNRNALGQIEKEKSFWKNKLILVADDEVTLTDFLSEILSGLGANVLCANNGVEAIKIARTNESSLDLIVLDAIMPVLDGLKAFQQIEKLDRKIPVVFASGYSEGETMSELRKKTGVGFIQKPFSKEEIVKKLKDTIEKQSLI